MAVTYAWRLDSDKYAYILPPYKTLDRYDASISSLVNIFSSFKANIASFNFLSIVFSLDKNKFFTNCCVIVEAP